MRTIKTALLSFGMSGRVFHAPFIQLHPGLTLTGSWERSKNAIQELYPAVQSYPTLQSVLEDKNIELLVVNTPTSTHYEYAKAALLAGKHVVVEKAFTTSVQEAIELKKLAASVEKKIAVFQNRRWDSDFKTVKKILASNLLGEIIEAEFHFDRFKPAIGPKLHKENIAPGAGLLNDLGPHLIDQALCLFGIPEAVFADIRITREQSQVDDWFDIVLYYAQCRVRLKAGYFVLEPLPAFVMHGRNGSFIKSRADVQETNLQAGLLPSTDDWGTEPESEQGLLHTEKNGIIIKEKIPTEQGNYFHFYDAVYNAIVNDTNMPVTCDDGIAVMQIIEAAVKSNASKALVTLL